MTPAASKSESRAVCRLAVSVSSGQAVVEIRDWRMKTVARGLAPIEVQAPQGWYSVVVSRPGEAEGQRVLELRDGETVTLVFGERDVEEHRAASAMAKSVAGFSQGLSLLLGATKDRSPLATPDRDAMPMSATPPPPAVDIRFVTLDSADRARVIRGVRAEGGVDAGVPFIDVRSIKQSPLIVQIAQPGIPVRNVVIPSRFLNAADVRILLESTPQRMKPRVRMRAEWAHAAAEFLARGDVRAAKDIVAAEVRNRTGSTPDILTRMVLRFRDITAISYLPYVVLRVASADELNRLPAALRDLPEHLTTLFAFLPDAHIVAAELAARMGDHSAALDHLLQFQSGELPVFTDGFAILVSRLRAYSAGDPEERSEGIDNARAAKARDLLSVVLRWAPYIDFAALTLTFTGSDPSRPDRETGTPVCAESREKEGWTLIPIETDAVDFKVVQEQEELQLKARRRALELPEDAPRVGLAFSGGGIRSATFNLGMLQGLAHRGLLPYVDYLSTVSGGGYLGGWLHGVIKRFGNGNPGNVRTYLDRPEHAPHKEANEDPIRFLRNYSSYLAPSLGLFSADFWSILVIWFRNMMLNWLMLVPFLGAISVLATIVGLASSRMSGPDAFVGWAVVIAIGATLGAVIIAGSGVRQIVNDVSSPLEKKASGFLDRNLWASVCVILLLISAIALACSSARLATIDGKSVMAMLFAVTFFLQFVLQRRGGFIECYQRMHPEYAIWAYPLGVFLPGVAATVSSGLMYLGIQWIAGWSQSAAGSWHVIAWGPPVMLLLWLAGAGLHIGVMGIDFPDFGREWLARVGAYINIAVAAWLLWFALAIFVPFWLAYYGLHWGKTLAGLVGTWIATTGVGVFSGGSDRTNGKGEEGGKKGVLELLGAVAPTVFAVGLFILVSFGTHVGLRAAARIVCPPAAANPQNAATNDKQRIELSLASDSSVHAAVVRKDTEVPGWLQWLVPIVNEYWCVLDSDARAEPVRDTGFLASIDRHGTEGWAWVFLIGSTIVILFVGWRVDINEFSLHHFYKNRLVRCYLGATRGRSRNPSRLTGFDSFDDFPIETLLPTRNRPEQRSSKTAEPPYLGPYAIVNTAVNIDHGSDMAKQERKCESFIFSPLFCGFDPPHSSEDERAMEKGLSRSGYRGTWNYLYQRKGPGMGTCMAISGAAANPNSGYHTSATIAFLLTMFDVRLGWWVGNPRKRSESKRPGPRFSPYPLISELFAQTDARASYLNLSDGGHFENLGVYELVKRRCRYIIAGDGEQDNDYNFESLGGVVRKCRADFGVDIRIDPRRIRPTDGLSRAHCVVGEIHYPDAPQGWLLYLKASMTGDEPDDVRQYKSVHPDFPHQPTPNQFFTESQFESYRKLGIHVTNSAFANLEVPESKVDFDHLFQCLYEQWYPPSEVADGVSSRHADTYSQLLRQLSGDRDLSYLMPQIFCPEKGDCGPAPEPESQPHDIEHKAFFFSLALIQLMENVWSDLHFFNKAERDNPKNLGWHSVFSHWARQPVFRDTWKRAHYTFNTLFQQYFETMRDVPDPAKRRNTYGRLPAE